MGTTTSAFTGAPAPEAKRKAVLVLVQSREVICACAGDPPPYPNAKEDLTDRVLGCGAQMRVTFRICSPESELKKINESEWCAIFVLYQKTAETDPSCPFVQKVNAALDGIDPWKFLLRHADYCGRNVRLTYDALLKDVQHFIRNTPSDVSHSLEGIGHWIRDELEELLKSHICEGFSQTVPKTSNVAKAAPATTAPIAPVEFNKAECTPGGNAKSNSNRIEPVSSATSSASEFKSPIVLPIARKVAAVNEWTRPFNDSKSWLTGDGLTARFVVVSMDETEARRVESHIRLQLTGQQSDVAQFYRITMDPLRPSASLTEQLKLLPFCLSHIHVQRCVNFEPAVAKTSKAVELLIRHAPSQTAAASPAATVASPPASESSGDDDLGGLDLSALKSLTVPAVAAAAVVQQPLNSANSLAFTTSAEPNSTPSATAAIDTDLHATVRAVLVVYHTAFWFSPAEAQSHAYPMQTLMRFFGPNSFRVVAAAISQHEADAWLDSEVAGNMFVRAQPENAQWTERLRSEYGITTGFEGGYFIKPVFVLPPPVVDSTRSTASVPAIASAATATPPPTAASATVLMT